MKPTAHQIKVLKSELAQYLESLGGSSSRIEYRKNGGYARAFICEYCDDRRIGEVRAYRDGRLFAVTVPQNRSEKFEIIDRNYSEAIRNECHVH